MAGRSETATGRVSTARCLSVFAGTLIAGAALVAGLSWAVQQLPMPGSLSVVILLVAAMQAGHGFARQAGRAPTGTETASFVVAATVLSLSLAMALVWGVLRWQGLPMTYAGFAAVFIRDPEAATWIGTWLTFCLETAQWLALLLLWLGFRTGVRLGLKHQDRAEVKPG